MRTTAQSGAPAGGGAYQTDLQVMDSASQYVQHVGDVMTNEVNRLISTLEAELNVKTWIGDDKNAFEAAKQDWSVKHQKLVKVLDEISYGLRKSSHSYNQAQQDNRDGIAQVVKNLGF